MFTSNTAEHDAANRRMLQKSAELKTVSAAFVATFVESGIFRLRLRQSLRQRCKTSTFATGSSLLPHRHRSKGGNKVQIQPDYCFDSGWTAATFSPSLSGTGLNTVTSFPSGSSKT